MLAVGIVGVDITVRVDSHIPADQIANHAPGSSPNPLAEFVGHTVTDSSSDRQVEKGWVFQDLIVECPSRYQVVGSSP